MDEHAEEIEYLRYFHREADFGPADEDVRDWIDEKFMDETGLKLPRGYEKEE